jgi:hypothetical protein
MTWNFNIDVVKPGIIWVKRGAKLWIRINSNLYYINLGQLSQYNDGLWDWGPGFNSWKGPDMFFLCINSRPTLTPTHPLIQWITVLNRPEREADNSTISSAVVKNEGSVSPLPYTSSWRGAEVVKSRETSRSTLSTWMYRDRPHHLVDSQDKLCHFVYVHRLLAVCMQNKELHTAYSVATV